MASNEINIPITSKYDDKGAKAALKDAQAIDKLKPEVKVTADTKAAERDITGLMKKVDLLDSDAATILLTSNATTIANEITDLIIDLDKLDADDADVQVKAEQINSLKGDLDQIEAKIRDVNDTPVDVDTKATTKGLDEVGKSAASSKSVLANMVGNSIQDLGALGGVAGSAGVAIGQMGEYMADASADGEKFSSILSNFGSVAGPIAALGAINFVIQAISGHLKEVAETKAFNEERVQGFVKALSDASLTAQELADILRGKQETGIFVRIQDESVNVQASIEKTLGTFQKFQDTVSKGQKGLDDYAATLVDNARKAGLNTVEMYNLRQALDDAKDGTISNKVAMAGLSSNFQDGVRTAAALGSAIAGVDVANKQAATSSAFYGRAVAESGGDANLAAQRTKDLTNQLNAYISSTKGVPSDVVSHIYADINEGSLNSAEAQIAILTRNRTFQVSANLTPTATQLFQDGRLVPGRSRYGGMAGPGGTIAGEAGPEFFRLPTGQQGLLTAMGWLPPGTQVTSTSETAQILAALERRPDVPATNVTIHLPRGTRPEDAVRAADRYARRNGRARASR